MTINAAATIRYSIAAILLGGYALWLGIAQARDADTGSAPISVLEYLLLLIIRVFRGPESAARTRKRMSLPARVKSTSRSYKLIGGLILGIGLLQLVLLLLLQILPE